MTDEADRGVTPDLCPACNERFHPGRGCELTVYFNEFERVTICEGCLARIRAKAKPDNTNWNAAGGSR